MKNLNSSMLAKAELSFLKLEFTCPGSQVIHAAVFFAPKSSNIVKQNLRIKKKFLTVRREPHNVVEAYCAEATFSSATELSAF